MQVLKESFSNTWCFFPNLLLLGYWSGMDLLKVPLGQQGQLQMDLWKVLLKD